MAALDPSLLTMIFAVATIAAVGVHVAARRAPGLVTRETKRRLEALDIATRESASR